MAKQLKYLIVRGEDLSDFVKTVNDYIEMGYKPHGNLVIGTRRSKFDGEAKDVFNQAVIKKI